MFFSVAVESPKQSDEAYGIIVPALCNNEYGCFSAADKAEQIPEMAKEAILLIVEEMISSGQYSVFDIEDSGVAFYSKHPEYKDYDTWFAIEVDLSSLQGKQQRINITLPDILIRRIDNRVKESVIYHDRSHFLAEAAKKALHL